MRRWCGDPCGRPGGGRTYLPHRRQVKGTIQRAPAPPQGTRQEYPYHTRVCSLRSQMRSGRVEVATGEARMLHLTPVGDALTCPPRDKCQGEREGDREVEQNNAARDAGPI